ASLRRVSASRSASRATRSAVSSARPIVSAAMRLRLATQTAKAAAATTAVTIAGMTTFATIGNTRDVLSSRGPPREAARFDNRKGVGDRPLVLDLQLRRNGPALPCGEVDEPA